LDVDRGPALRLITLNLLNDRSRWAWRRPLIVDQLAALQEVTPAPNDAKLYLIYHIHIRARRF
jgi:hypothetical protein